MSITHTAQASSVLYHPTDTTESQRKFADARRERLARMNGLAVVEVSPSESVQEAIEPAPPVTPPEPERPKSLFEQWMDAKFDPFAPTNNRSNHKAIQLETLKHFPDCTRADILSSRRNSYVVRARQIAMFVCKQRTLGSLPQIGRWFGGRDHTTALHAVKKIEKLVLTDPETARIVGAINAALDAPLKDALETPSAPT